MERHRALAALCSEAGIEAAGLPACDVVGLTADSRQVTPGMLFVALVGQRWDGHDFVGSALLSGACAVVVQAGVPRKPIPDGACVIEVPDTRQTLARLASAFYGPLPASFGDRLMGITGTNGKTTTSFILEAILNKAGHLPGVIGTVNYRAGETVFPAPLTTPDVLLLWRLLERMSEAGADSLLMEVSSHALDQYRVHGIPFHVVGWTNLTQDHLDYHVTMEAYGAAKAKLWQEVVVPEGTAVLNADDLSCDLMAKGARCKVWRYSLDPSKKAEISVHEAHLHMRGISGRIETPAGQLRLESSLMGRFNLSNLALAVGMSVAQGIPLQTIEEGIASMRAVPGRLEAVDADLPFQVLVDYAHTPDALAQVLSSLRPLCPQRLITVFGCGGDRDRAKRPQMGQIAASLSDICLVTSDNPRTEDPQKIVDDIVEGFAPLHIPKKSAVALGQIQRITSSPSATSSSTIEEGATASHADLPPVPRAQGYLVELDRRKAIQLAVEMAAPDDILLIAGKGHEDYQVVGTTRYPFDDRKIAKQALEARFPQKAEDTATEQPASEPETTSLSNPESNGEKS
ncbi:MAG: UDP-N-acetylmuramoyl-L-alanyl-D-glutamate--2,6-diaminopimelate ligase [Myxococcales bacterium]|nr:UDP-N-acetylmuramoyl-L-alanyl-D-glutamate--2,6-diaminopimelate ligase [Myxococcales bacterium]